MPSNNIATISKNQQDIIKLNADRLYSFCEGFAIIQQGKSQAIIDKNGRIIIPYNKYIYTDFGLGSLEPLHGFINGGCIVKNTGNGLTGMINNKGEIIIPVQYLIVYPFDDEGWARVMDTQKNDYFINRAGEKLPIPKIFYYYRQGVISANGSIEDLFNGGPTRERALSGKTYSGNFYKGLSPANNDKSQAGYYSRQGTLIIGGTYTSAEPFYEGLACVSKLDEYGQNKYGFIDINGKEVIPFMYSIKPGNFYNGLAYVEPPNKTESDFAFIDKSNQMKMKFKKVTPILKPYVHFENGFLRLINNQATFDYVQIIDSAGNDNKVIASLRNKISSVMKSSGVSFDLKDNIQIFYFKNSSLQAKGSLGFVNIVTGKTIYTDFTFMEPFDSVSHLALANDYNLGNVYIDETGNIVMSVQKKANW